jgi:urease accessory protein
VQRSIGTLDLPILHRLHRAWSVGDAGAVTDWNARLIAARESAELRAEERHLGSSLARVLIELDVHEATLWRERDTAFATLFSLAAVRWQIPSTATLSGYVWAWLENQVLAAVKLVPLGQSAGQRLLHALTEDVPALVARADEQSDAEIGTGALSQVLAACRHERQYSRLFRS